MTEENQEPQESEDSVGGEVPESQARESGEQTPDSKAQDDDLTVDDILNTEQTEAAASEDEANEYLEDLRRIGAEFANYRKRTEDNRELERQRATATAVATLLPILDDLDRAEKHGDLEDGSPFHTIAQKFRGSMEKLGLNSFGEEGEDFDPNRHEAISQVPTPGLETAVVLEVFERGYKIGDVELRAAKVIVAVPADG